MADEPVRDGSVITIEEADPTRIHSSGAEDDTHVYVVLRNDEEQYSLWREEIPVPDGWTATGFRGTQTECVAHVDEVWTDIRPKSAREAIDRKWAELDAQRDAG
jgi:MbtH protein